MQRRPRPSGFVVSPPSQHDETTSLRVEGAAIRTEVVIGQQSGSTHPRSLGKRPHKLDPALKSWLDNVIIPALVREYLAEIEKRNRLAMTSGSEVTSE